MKFKLRFNWSEFKNWKFWLKVGLVVVIILAGTAGVFFAKRYKVIAPITERSATVQTAQPVAPPEEAKKEIAKAPPKTKTSGSTSTRKNADGTSTTTSSTGPTNSADAATAAAAGPSGNIAGIDYIDQTGTHPDLGDQLKIYMSSNLLVGGEVTNLYSIILKNAGDTGWAGLYSGSYTQDQSGRINSAWGYITLNSYYYEGNPYFLDYMKLILSHEYGHHYTLYYKWLVWQLGVGTRFPDSYYSIRPLSYTTTAADYSKGWVNCDAEIIAEDYSYFYSGYGYHAMSGTYGYPSAGTRTWLVNEPSGPSAPAPSDSPPTVSMTAPANGATVSDTITLSANASDDNGVARVAFFIDSTLISEDSSAPYSASLNTLSYGNGAYTLKARAYDTVGQTAENAVSVTISNTSSDAENPTITITAPVGNPYNWVEGNLTITASATDNVAVQKIELYINDQLVATENAATIARVWQQNNAPAGTYTLKAKSYDTSNNTAETTITIVKTF
ncbi:MAG: Ig-like domain-containing protein [Patescibacteria group bacterium]